MTRSTLIREVETDLINARARALLRQPKHPRQTWTDVKAERAARRRRYGKLILWTAILLTAATVAVSRCAL